VADLARRVPFLLVSALAIAAVSPLLADEASVPKLSASSSAPDHPPAAAMDGKRETSWRSEGAGEQELRIDLGAPRKAGGLAVAWEPELGASHFLVEASDDGKEWRIVRRIYGASGEKSWLRIPAAEARFLRLRFVEGDGPAYGVREIDLLPAEVAGSVEALYGVMARDARRGLFPRGVRGEAASGMSAGGGGDRGVASLSADGAFEPAGGLFLLEPFVRVAGRLVTWADVTAEGSREGEADANPTAAWTTREIGLDVAALREGASGASRMLVRYRLRNRTAGKLVATLVLAIRPFLSKSKSDKAGAPWRVASIRTLGWDGRQVLVNGRPALVPLRPPASFNAAAFAAGDVTTYLEAGRVPPEHEVEDASGLASGLLAFPLSLEAHAAAEVVVEIPPSPGAGATKTP
jgi:hypothetical protein